MIDASLIAFTAGGVLFGWLLPQLVVMLSTRPFVVKSDLNFACAIAFGLLAYGVRA